MTQPANVVDLAPRSSGAPPAQPQTPARPVTQLLGVIPLPDNGTAMAIVAHIIPARRVPRSTQAAAGDALAIDREARRVWSYGREIDLTYLEFELLAQITAAPERVFTRAQLLDTTWGGGPITASRTIDVHIHRLRRKLGDGGKHLVTVRRVGYKYDPHVT